MLCAMMMNNPPDSDIASRGHDFCDGKMSAGGGRILCAMMMNNPPDSDIASRGHDFCDGKMSAGGGRILWGEARFYTTPKGSARSGKLLKRRVMLSLKNIFSPVTFPVAAIFHELRCC
jgi:hypothetical protein